MVSLFAVLGAIAAVGLLLALDPGGAIADSGFPDYQDMDWKQLTAWAFRLIGVGVALLLMLILSIKERAWKPVEYREPAEGESRQAIVLPAAAVSVLEDREVTGRTLLASIVEMCQRGTLQLERVGTKSGYRFALSRQGPARFDWEQLLCDSLPSNPTSIRELHGLLNEHKDSIGDQLGDYLHGQGLFHDNPVRTKREHFGDGVGLAMLVGALMGVGGGLWLALWLSQWWANSLIGAAIGIIYWLIATPVNAGLLSPTDTGAYEIGEWQTLREFLPGPEQAGGDSDSDSMLAFAIALNAAQPWLNDAAAPPWFRFDVEASLRSATFRRFLSAPEWGLARTAEGEAEATSS